MFPWKSALPTGAGPRNLLAEEFPGDYYPEREQSNKGSGGNDGDHSRCSCDFVMHLETISKELLAQMN